MRLSTRSTYLRALVPTALVVALGCLGPSTVTTPAPTAATSVVAMPTAFVCKAALIEQSFEHGFMFWIGHSTDEKCAETHSFARNTGEIWVAYAYSGDLEGKWLIFADDWDSSADIESDSTLNPPVGLFQPIRGFGKTWRVHMNEVDRLALGWATGNELPYEAEYRYEAGGFFDSSGRFVTRPGKHIIRGLAGDTFIFDEVSQTVTYSLPAP